MATATKEKIVADEQAAYDQETAVDGQDADNGKLFDVPRVAVAVDDTDPTLLKLSFSGGIEIERSEKSWVDFYNKLKAGESRTLQVTLHVAGSKKVHRRDGEGDVDAVVETKSLIITDIHQ